MVALALVGNVESSILATDIKPIHTLFQTIGGDTFGLILKNIGSRENCEKVSTRVANIFRKGLLPVGEELTASLGVTIYPDDSRDFEQLILKAEHLASEAKNVPGTFFLFSTDEQKKVN